MALLRRRIIIRILACIFEIIRFPKFVKTWIRTYLELPCKIWHFVSFGSWVTKDSSFWSLSNSIIVHRTLSNRCQNLIFFNLCLEHSLRCSSYSWYQWPHSNYWWSRVYLINSKHHIWWSNRQWSHHLLIKASIGWRNSNITSKRRWFICMHLINVKLRSLFDFFFHKFLKGLSIIWRLNLLLI